jgi:porin
MLPIQARSIWARTPTLIELPVIGGAIHFAVTNRHGKSLSAIALGNNTSVQEVWGTQNTHLAILTWEQKLFDGRLWFRGWPQPGQHPFPELAALLQFPEQLSCGNPTFVFKNSNFTYFPASSWMAHAKLKLTGNVSAHVGVYEVNPDRKRADDDGFSLSTRNATGVIIPWELAMRGAGGHSCPAIIFSAGGSIARTTPIR